MIVVKWSLACVNDRDPFNKIVCEDRWFFHKIFGNLDFWEFCWSLVWDDPLKLNNFCSFFQTFLLYRNEIYLYCYNLRLTSLKTILTFLTSIFQLRPFGWFQTLYQKIQYFSKIFENVEFSETKVETNLSCTHSSSNDSLQSFFRKALNEKLTFGKNFETSQMTSSFLVLQ